jgi:16S rRNA A1518/A1519 N6-dimethyltransferase RsmA/KsgA/DIM1 with predicted DNA glycosylase/AP lyase activity
MGSGGGHLCRTIARNLPEVQVTGVEISPLPWLRSVIVRALFGPRNLRLIRQDFWSFDLSEADAVVMLLEPVLADRLGQKLHRELKPGSLIVSNEVKLGDGWEPAGTRTIKLFGMVRADIHIYRQG